MKELPERLDEALAGRLPPDAETAPLLAALSALESLQAGPPRSAEAARAGLEAFLRTARQAPAPSAVSPAPPARLTGWKLTLFRKELSPMNVLVLLALVASLAFGGAGATAYAAQGSLPDEPLYAVKLLTEDLRQELAGDPSAQLALALELAQTRTQEMARLAEAGRAIPEPAAARLGTHLETALQLTAEVGEPQLAAALAQLQQQTQAQLQSVTEARRNAPADLGLRLAEQHLTQTQALTQLGLEAPAQFRNQVRAGQLAPSVTPPAGLTRPGPGAGFGPGDGACDENCTPELDGNSYGPGLQHPAQRQRRPAPSTVSAPAPRRRSCRQPAARAHPSTMGTATGPDLAIRL